MTTNSNQTGGLPAPDKVFDLDAFYAAKKSTPPPVVTTPMENEPADEPEDKPSDEPKDEPVDTAQGDKKSEDSASQDADEPADEPVDGKDDVDGKGDKTDSKAPDADKSDDKDEPVDLSEIMIKVGEEDRSVLDVINERNEFATRLNEIEQDDFLREFIKRYKETGNVKEYLEATQKDYTAMSDLEVVKLKFDKDNARYPEKIREKMWKREIAAKYMVNDNLTDYDKESDDYEIAQAMLKRDAEDARGNFITEQKKFLVPERKAEPEKQKQPKFDPEAYRKQVMTEKEVADFLKTKLLPLEYKDESGATFKYEPSNPEQVVEMMTDDRKFWMTMVKDGKIDRVLQAKVSAYATDPKAFEQKLIEYGKTLAIEERLKEAKNTDGRLSKKTTGAQKGAGDWKTRFLQEALKQKKR
jgi:hypothetical protein